MADFGTVKSSKEKPGRSLVVVQWLELHASNAGHSYVLVLSGRYHKRKKERKKSPSTFGWSLHISPKATFLYSLWCAQSVLHSIVCSFAFSMDLVDPGIWELSSWPEVGTLVLCIGRWILNHWPIREVKPSPTYCAHHLGSWASANDFEEWWWGDTSIQHIALSFIHLLMAKKAALHKIVLWIKELIYQAS